MKTFATAIGIAFLLSTPSAFGVTLGQRDTFQSGVENWVGGTGGLALVPNGGPAGAGDQFLQLSSGNPPLPPRTIILNDAQWLGDYLAAGVNSVAMDLRNSGS